MIVRGERIELKRNAFTAVNLPETHRAQAAALAIVNADSAAEVRQGECGHPVTSVRGAQQRKERRVLSDRQDLPIGKSPPAGSEVAGEKIDLAEQRLIARAAAAAARGENSLKGDDRMECER